MYFSKMIYEYLYISFGDILVNKKIKQNKLIILLKQKLKMKL